MKRFKVLPLLAIAFLAIAALFVSCSNNNDEIVGNLLPNSMTVQSRTYTIKKVTVEDKGASYEIELKSNIGDIDVSITYPKSAIGKRIDLSKSGNWEFDGEVVEAKGWQQVLAEGSYVAVNSYNDGRISLSYLAKQLRGANVEAGNYSGRVTVKHDD